VEGSGSNTIVHQQIDSKMTMTRGIFTVLMMALAGSANAGGAVELTQSNFAEKTKGKNSFVKFVSNIFAGNVCVC
jgi:hypothetical protein